MGGDSSMMLYGFDNKEICVRKWDRDKQMPIAKGVLIVC